MSHQNLETNNHKTNQAETGQYLTLFQRNFLQTSLQEDLPQKYQIRIKIMLLFDEGKTQTEICQKLGCSPATARYWIFVTQTGQAHNWRLTPIGRPKEVNREFLERLQELVSQSPRNFGYFVSRWTANRLRKHLSKEFGTKVSDRHINRLLKQMGLSTQKKTVQTQNDNQENNADDRLVITDLDVLDRVDSKQFWLFDYPEN